MKNDIVDDALLARFIDIPTRSVIMSSSYVLTNPESTKPDFSPIKFVIFFDLFSLFKNQSRIEIVSITVFLFYRKDNSYLEKTIASRKFRFQNS